ncbi:hypothetical protein GNP95_21540 [Paenibacillus woosongensis]|uniref:Uncharacterized protein n=1 Tax=Paenibacillus woosongensis TaxID=307580 RepID=A0A7X2Z4R5_9BACL|nr:hypothetical protein [Paenibacillus woosongensis]
MWLAVDQSRLEQDVLNRLIPFTQGQKDSIHTAIGIEVQAERYSGAEIMHSLGELARQGVVVEIDGRMADLNEAGSDDYSLQDAAVMKAAALLDLKESYHVLIDYDFAGRAQKIAFQKK